MTGPAQSSYFAVIKVVGVGGGGVNAVNRMIEAGLKGVEFIAMNTDSQALLMSDADLKLDIGRQLTRGLGAGQRPRGRPPGRRGAPGRDRRGAQGRGHGLHHRRQGRRHRDRAPHRWWPRSPRPAGALTIGVVTRPFSFEGRRRSVQAETGIQHLKEKVDAIIIIPNDRLLTVSTEKTSMVNAFKMADEVLLQGRAGDHRPHHRAGPDQHRLRRRAHGAQQRRARPSWASARPPARAGPSTRHAARSRARCSRPRSRAPGASW